MFRKGEKTLQWEKDRERLKVEYQEHGITSCEGSVFNDKCMHNFALSFHHLDRRSSGDSENTFEETRLLCAHCHHMADQASGHKVFNERLRALR
jgi:hypothetical protein